MVSLIPQPTGALFVSLSLGSRLRGRDVRPFAVVVATRPWIGELHQGEDEAMRPYLVALCVASILGSGARAQEMWFFYPLPPTSAVEVLKDQPYGTLQMDVYRPASGGRKMLPVLVFFNIASGASRSNTFYSSWAQIAAAQGLVAILPDLRDESFEKDFDAAIAHLTANAASLGVDRDRIAVYAGSGNVWRALPLLQNPARTAIKTAVMYYGAATVPAFRRDLPFLLVRAGLDRPGVNTALTDLVTQAMKENAPVTLLNYSGGHHAFEIVDDEDAMRDVVDSTITYVKRTTLPAYHASLQRGLAEATAAAYVATGDFARAAASYAELVKNRRDDARRAFPMAKRCSARHNSGRHARNLAS
jgi:dienelactone hydrolase